MAAFGEDGDVSFRIKKRLEDELEEEERAIPATSSSVEGGHMKVYLRIRPITDTERNTGEDQQCIKLQGSETLVTYAPKDSNTFKNAGRSSKCVNQKFTFSKIFDEDTSQKKFFDEAVLGTVKEFIKGQNCLLFTYGVTNSGKTYTVQGYQSNVGILPRALELLFSAIKDRQWQGHMLKPTRFCDVMSLSVNQQEDDLKLKKSLLKMAEVDEPDAGDMTINMSRVTADSTMSEDSLMLRQSSASSASMTSIRDSGELDAEMMSSIISLPTDDDNSLDLDSLSQFKCCVWISFAEIYNENIHDLLEPLSAKRKTIRSRPMLQLREDKNGTPYVRGLKEVHCNSADEAYKLLTLGRKNLQIACTKLNRNSSRSHCIFTIKLIQVVDKDNPHAARTSMLSFCDLAGSERYTNTQSVGDRIKEAGNINTSLLTLGRCIQVLRHNQTNKDHPQVVPFRDSKLTRLFQSFFCGKGRASMIVNINPCASTFDETLHALKYSAIAKQIIVVQEPEKPKVVQSARQFSMLLNQSSRQTIGWATPGTYAKIFQDEELLEGSDEDDEEETASETEREKELMELVELMKGRLIEEKKKMLLMEVRIREEVCQEMAQQLVDIEHHYSERLKREQVYQEEKAEKRMDILTQSVLKSRKRQRIFDDDNEKPDKDSIEHQDSLAALQAEVVTLREAATPLGQERDKLQQENTAIKFQLQDLENQLEALSSANKADESMSQSSVTEMGELISKLSDAEAETEKRTAEVTKLQQVIDILQCNAAEDEDKMDAIKSEHNKSKKQIASLEKELASNDHHVKSLERAIEKKDLKLSEMQSQCQQQDEQLFVLQASVDQVSAELEKLQADNDQQEEIVTSLRQEIAERNDNYDRLQLSLSLREGGDTELQKALDEKMAAVKCFEEQVQSLKEEVEASRSEREQVEEKLRTGKVEAESELEDLQSKLSSCQRQLDEAQELVVQREEELETIKTSLEDKGGLQQELVQLSEDLSHAKHLHSAAEKDLQQAHDRQQELETEQALQDEKLKAAESLQADLDAAVAENQELQSREDTLKVELEDALAKVGELGSSLESIENELFVAQEGQQNLNDRASEAESKLKDLKGTLQEAQNSHQKSLEEYETKLEQSDHFVSGKDAEISELKEELDSMKSKLCETENEQKSKQVVESEYKKLQKRFKDSQEQLEDYTLKVNEEMAELNSKLTQLQTENREILGKLEQQSQNSTKVVDKLQGELKQQQDLLDVEHGKFEKQVLELEDEIKSLKKKLELNDAEQAKKDDRIDEENRKLSGLQMTMDIAEEEQEAERLQHQEEMANTRAELQTKTNCVAELESEVDHLRSQASGQEHDKSEAQSEMEELKRQIRALEQKLDDAEYNHQMSCRQLRRENGNTEKLLKSTEEANGELETKVQKLEEEISSEKQKQENKVKQLNESLTAQRERVSKLEEVIKDLESCLKSSKEHEEKANKELENLKLKCRRLETDCNMKEDTICSLNEEMERFREESIMVANSCSAESTTQMDSLRKEVMDLKKTVDDLEFELNDVREEKILCERESEAKVQEALDEINKLSAQSEQLKKQLEDLEKCSTKAEEKLKYMDEIVQSKQAEITLLEESSQVEESSLEKLQNRVAELETKLKESKNQSSSESKDLQSQLIAKTNELQECKNMLERREHTLEEATKQKQELEIERDLLNSKLEKQQNCMKESSSNLEEQLDTQSRELSASCDLVSKHMQQISELEEQCINLRDELEVLQEKHSSLEVQLKAKVTEVMECNNKISELSRFEEKCRSLEGEVTELKDTKHNLEENVATKERHLSGMTDLEKRLVELEKVDASSKQKIEALNLKIKSETSTNTSLKEEMISLKQKLQEQAPKVDECKHLQSSVSSLETKVASLQSSAADSAVVSNKLSDLETELEILSKQKEKSDRLVRTLQEEVDDLEDKMKEKTKKSSNTVSELEQEIEKLQSTMKKNLAEKESEVQQELESLKREMKEKADSLMTAELRCKKLKEELDNKEQRLKSRNESLTNFMTKMDAEKTSYELALKDARSNEMLIETLKKAMEEQESVMQTQDRVLECKEDELKQMMEDIDTHLTRIQQLQTSEKDREETGRGLKKEKEAAERRAQSLESDRDAAERRAQSLESDRERAESQCQHLKQRLNSNTEKDEEWSTLQRSKDRVDDKLATTRARLEEAEKKLRLKSVQEEDLRETTQELQVARRQLKAQTEELASLKKKLKAQEAQEAERGTSRRDDHTRDSHALQMLKIKFQAKEDLVHQLEQEKIQWKARAENNEEQLENIKEQNSLELNKWRTERDKLVDKLQQILQEKDAEIKTLQHGDESQLVSALRRQLEERASLIQQMSAEAERGTALKRRGRSSRHPASSSSSDDDAAGLKRELQHLHKQIEQIHQEHKLDISKVVKAKDAIISDMRSQNHKLTIHLSGEQVSSGYQIPMAASTPAPAHHRIPSNEREEPSAAKSKSRRGRPKKRSETEMAGDMSTSASTTKRGRKTSSRSAKSKSLLIDENDDPSLIIISEDIIDLDESTRKPALNNSTNLLDLTSDVFQSPKVSAAPPVSSQKRKKRLKRTVEQPLMDSPTELSSAPLEEPTPAHDIVKRTLRSRRK